MTKSIKTSCLICGEDFEAYRRSAKVCGTVCRKELDKIRANNWYSDNHDVALVKRREASRKFIIESPEKKLYQAARDRAKNASIDFSIDLDDIKIPEICPVFERPFERKTQYAASLDRIDSSKGYVKGNIQVISKLANTMKSNSTKEQQRKFAEWLLKN